MLVTTKEMLLAAQKGGYAVGHFNTSNLEFSQAIIEAATEMKSPVIIAASVKALQFAGIDNIAAIVRRLAHQAPVPVALHLDHGPDIHWARECLAHGFTSIMIDTSSKPYEENVRLTREVVELCKPLGVPVEAELGQLKGIEDDVVAADHVYTDPALAVQFVAETGCDSLAVAIGTSHGAYKFSGESHLDTARLQAIRDKVSVPLVLHGASEVPQELLQKANSYGAKISGAHGVTHESIASAIQNGICKINTDTDIRVAFTAAAREFMHNHPEEIDPRALLAYTREAVKNMVRERIQLFGSAGKA